MGVNALYNKPNSLAMKTGLTLDHLCRITSIYLIKY